MFIKWLFSHFFFRIFLWNLCLCPEIFFISFACPKTNEYICKMTVRSKVTNSIYCRARVFIIIITFFFYQVFYFYIRSYFVYIYIKLILSWNALDKGELYRLSNRFGKKEWKFFLSACKERYNTADNIQMDVSRITIIW